MLCRDPHEFESEVVVIFEALASSNISENKLADWFKTSSVPIANA